MGNFYDGGKLLSLKDINGETPEIYICTSNRSAGKTTYFNRLVTNRFLKSNKKFALLYRYNYEVSDAPDKFFKDICGLFFPEYTMRGENRANGVYSELYLCKGSDKTGIPCGYALALNNADQIKKYSHMFSDTEAIVFDEFQSETSHYCSDEVRKLISIHKSIARGQSKMYRYVPLYMISNPVTLLNPYYVEMGISERLNSDTKFLKGDGFVLEQGFNETAKIESEKSGVMRAFAKNEYVAYAGQGIYLNDNSVFIEKPEGFGRYIATLKYKKAEFGVREFPNAGIIYCDNHPDATFKVKLAVTTDDMEINYVMLKRNELFIENMRYFFDRGCFRFKDLKCKEAIMKTLAYY